MWLDIWIKTIHGFKIFQNLHRILVHFTSLPAPQPSDLTHMITTWLQREKLIRGTRRVNARVFKHTGVAGRGNHRPNWSFQTSQLVISYNMDNIHNHEVDAYVYIEHYITRSNSNCLNRFEIKLLKYVWIIYLCVQGEGLGVFLYPLPYTHPLPIGLPQTPTLPSSWKVCPYIILQNEILLK